MKVKIKVCKECGKEFMPTNFNQKVCGYICAIAFTKSKTVEEVDDDGWKERKKDLKESIKTISDYKKELQDEVNHLARLVDKGKRCIATDNASAQHGGHYHSVGSNPSVRFNLHNIHAQSIHSNKFKGGQPIEYRAGLLKRYGKEYVDYIDSLPLEYPILKPTKDELVEATKIARRLVREMIKEDKIYTGDDAIKKRAEINSQLGLYN